MKVMNPLTSRVFESAISRFPDTAQQFLTRYGLFLLTSLRLRRIPLVLLRGPIHSSGQTGSLLVAGHDPWVAYLPNRFFLNQPHCERLGNVPIGDLPDQLHRWGASADMTIIRVDRLSAGRIADKEDLVVPEWVGMRMAVPADLNNLVRECRSIHEDMRLSRRHNLQSFVTESGERFDEFYDDMYIPFSQARHGPLAFVKSREDLRRRVRNGGILWVYREKQPLAGMLYERKDHLLDLQALGTAMGELPVKKRGIMAALYYFTIAHARRLGCTDLDFRGVRPSLHDGLVRYKRKWGNRLYDKTDSYFDLLVRWNTFNKVVKEFLSHTSLIFREGDGLSAIHTDESLSPRSVWVGGLNRLYLLTDSGRVPMLEENQVNVSGLKKETAECSPR